MRVMVLGGSSNQIDLIKSLKSNKHEVILIDYLKDCLGKKIADIHLLISTFDTEEILKAAKEYKVDRIVTSGTDQPVYSAAYVSEKLNLPFYIDSKTALNVTNKIHMKKIFKDNNIPSVNYKLVKADFKSEELKNIKFPVVLKPVDTQGQRGIFKLESIEEVKNKINESLSFSREEFALVEEYYENDEITVNGWVENSNVYILSVVDRVTIKLTNRIGICLCHNFPSLHLKKYNNDISKITNGIVKAFNIENGPIYFQYLIGKEGIKVNEIAMRIGGAYEGLTIPIIANVDIIKLVTEYKKGISSNLPKEYKVIDNKIALSTQMFFARPGVIKYITPVEEIKKIKGVVTAHHEYSKGDVIKDIKNATARAGYFIIKGKNFDDMIDNVNNAFEQIKILDENNKNLIFKYKDYEGKYLFNS